MKLFGRRRITYPPPESYVTPPVERLKINRDADGSYSLYSEISPTAIYTGTHPDTINRSAPIPFEYYRATNLWRVDAGLDTTTRPYFEIHFEDGTRRIIAERILSVEGVVNFRDIGGYPTADGRHTRWGQVYRTGMLGELTDASRAYLQALEVRWVCDLRSEEEIEHAPDQLGDHSVIRYQHKSLFAPNDTSKRLRALLFNKSLLPKMMQEMYINVLVEANAKAYGEILRDIADPANRPMLMHCTAGKDRTGVGIMLLLLALGVPDDIVIADYSLSNHYFTTFRAYTADLQKRLRWFGLSLDDITPMLIADPANVRAGIDHIRTKYGSIDTYLLNAAGLDAETLSKLRESLLE